MKKETIINRLIDFIFAVIVPTFIVFYFLGNLIFGRGFIFYGDTQWPIYTYHNILNPVFYAWDNGSPTSSTTLFYSLFTYTLIRVFGTYAANHLFVFLIPFLSGFFSYFSIKWTLKLYGYKGFITQIASVIGATFYLANWQDPNLITPLYTWGFSYFITPILIFLFLRILSEHKKSDMLIFAIISMIGDSVPMWILTLGLYIIILLTIKFVRRDKINSLIKSIKDTILLIMFTIIANSYFIIESVGGFLLGAGGQYAAYSSSGASISAAKTSSVLSLLDVFVFGQSKYYFFGLNPKNWSILNFALPLSVIFFIIVLIFIKIEPSIRKEEDGFTFKFKFIKTKELKSIPLVELFASLLILLIISLFLSKGFNPPFGQLYYIVLLISPPGVQGITRDVEPFLMISSLAYSFIFSIITLISLKYLLLKINVKKGTTFKRIKVKKLLPFLILFILLGTAFFATFQETSISTQVTNNRFHPIFLPSSINASVNYLNSLNPKGNIMWMPTGGTYPWKDNLTLTDFGANLVANSSTPFYLYSYLFEERGNHLGILLDLSNTQYFVYNSNASFAFNYPLEMNETQILALLKNQTDLKLIHSDGGIFIYKNLAYTNTLYAGVPNIGNLHSSLFNITKLVNGSNIFVTDQNPYLDLFYSHIIKPTYIINNTIRFSNISSECVGVYNYSYTRTDYDYNSTIFSIKNYSVSDGKLYICLKYSIPSYLKKFSGNGQFVPSFSVQAILYKSTNDLPTLQFNENNKIIFVAPGPSAQKQTNSTSGLISFEIPAISGNIGVKYYLSSFQTASPVYYVGTLNDTKILVDPIENSSIMNSQLNFTNYNDEKNVSFLVTQSPSVIITNGKAILNYNAYVIYPELYVFKKLNISSIFSKLNIHIIPIYFNSTAFNLLIFEKESQQFSILKNKTMIIYLNTPVNGTFHLKINVNGNIFIKGLGNISGEKSFNISIQNSYKLDLYAMNNSSVYIEVYQKNNGNTGNLSNIEEISPVLYRANIRWNGTVLIVLPEEYSNMWTLEYDGREYSPISLYGGSATGFILVNPNGNFSISFKMQTYLEIGYIISFSFVVIAVLIIIINRRRK
ncbi:hypothetical protein [Caldiplasma sukawensis]